MFCFNLSLWGTFFFLGEKVQIGRKNWKGPYVVLNDQRIETRLAEITTYVTSRPIVRYADDSLSNHLVLLVPCLAYVWGWGDSAGKRRIFTPWSEEFTVSRRRSVLMNALISTWCGVSRLVLACMSCSVWTFAWSSAPMIWPGLRSYACCHYSVKVLAIGRKLAWFDLAVGWRTTSCLRPCKLIFRVDLKKKPLFVATCLIFPPTAGFCNHFRSTSHSFPFSGLSELASFPRSTAASFAAASLLQNKRSNLHTLKLSRKPPNWDRLCPQAIDVLFIYLFIYYSHPTLWSPLVHNP